MQCEQLSSINQSINQSIINPYVAWLLQGWNCYITQFDSLEQRSDDEIWIRFGYDWLVDSTRPKLKAN